MKHNKIIHILFVGFLVLALCAPGIAKKKKEIMIESQWAQNPVRIDGMNDDWANSIFNSEKKVKVDYAFMNDAQNLYILFIFKKPTTRYISSIDFTGMKILFSPEGKKVKDYGIRFIVKKISADEYIALLEKEIGPASEAKKEQIRANPAYVLYGHEMISKESSEGLKLMGPVFRSKRQQGTFIYEFSIPLEKLAELSSEIGAEPGKSIQVGFEWGGMTAEIKKALAARIGDGIAKAQDQKAGGLTSERRAGSGLGDVESSRSRLEQMRRMRPKKHSFWVSLKLAQSK